MLTGKYVSIAWDELICYAIPQLHANSVKFGSYFYDTCGTSALSVLSGVSPKSVQKYRPKSNKYWSDSAVIGFLKKRRFIVQSVTKCGVTNLSRHGDAFERMPIGHLHVLLCNSLCCRNEASWFIVHGNVLFHNFESFELNPFFFVNKPPQSIWVVKHPKWNLINMPISAVMKPQ